MLRNKMKIIVLDKFIYHLIIFYLTATSGIKVINMPMMEAIPEEIKIIKKQLEEWFRELLYRTNNVEDHFQFVDREMSINIYFYTKDNRYSITAKKEYLGCQVSSRKPRAGEDWTRGNDLPDGKFNRDTWNNIKNAIISYELVKIAKKEIDVGEYEDIPNENIET